MTITERLGEGIRFSVVIFRDASRHCLAGGGDAPPTRPIVPGESARET